MSRRSKVPSDIAPINSRSPIHHQNLTVAGAWFVTSFQHNCHLCSC